KPVWLLLISAILFIVPMGFLNGLMFLMAKIEPNSVTIYTAIQKIEASIIAYSQGSWVDVFWQRLDDWLYMGKYGSMFISILFMIVPFLLVGAAAAKLKLIERARELKLFWIITIIITLAAG